MRREKQYGIVFSGVYVTKNQEKEILKIVVVSAYHDFILLTSNLDVTEQAWGMRIWK
jgi:hypothetical protein